MRSYPFTAVVGQEDLALALALSSVSPAVGGVLVRGEKGTAKSTMVRALAGLLPPVDVVAGCRFSCDPAEPDPGCPDGPHVVGAHAERRPARLVELPVGATEDRVLGSLHLERALSEGVSAYDPGLLAAANRGLLYVDEVNLLHDHLVDVLLDAAAMGRATVERESVSVAHAARFVLVGTMNPEEGELRPQLLDRFGLTVEVAASRDPEVRVEVVRRRMAYEASPDAFAASYDALETAFASRIATARALLPSVVLGDVALRQIAEVCAAFEVDGMRGDLVTARTAVAHAAWSGRTEVTRDDVRAAARLALPHRRRRLPFDAPGLDEKELDRALDDATPPEPDGPDDGPGGPGDGGPDGDTPRDQPTADAPPPGSNPPGSTPPPADAAGPTSQADPPGTDGPQTPADRTDTPAAEDAPETPVAPGAAPTRTVAAGEAYKPRLLRVPGSGAGAAGRRSRAITSVGRTVGATRPVPGENARPHLPATLMSAAPHQRTRGRSGPGLVLRSEDVRVAVREGRESNLVLFCVDASGSMGARTRMKEVKAAVLSLLLDAYQRRDKVGLVTFRGAEAELALPPTSSVEAAAARLEKLPTGGRTPLAEGLLRAAQTLRVEAIRDPRRRPLLLVVTDGRATSGKDAVARAQAAGAALAGVATVVIDCESGPMRLGLAADLAVAMQAEHLPLGAVAADALSGAVRERTGRAA